MSVAIDLQTVIGRIGVAVAGGDTYTRVDLERLGRELGVIREEASREERQAYSCQQSLRELADGVVEGVIGISQLAARARARIPAAGEQMGGAA